MNFGKITVVTPPDKLFNNTISYLLVKPSAYVKSQFHQILSQCPDELTVFVFDEGDTDIDWLLSVSTIADVIIIDIDNCDQITKQFVPLMLTNSNSYYITTNETVPYRLISKNRIFNLDWIVEQFNNDDDFDEDDEEWDEDEDE